MNKKNYILLNWENSKYQITICILFSLFGTSDLISVKLNCLQLKVDLQIPAISLKRNQKRVARKRRSRVSL